MMNLQCGTPRQSVRFRPLSVATLELMLNGDRAGVSSLAA